MAWASRPLAQHGLLFRYFPVRKACVTGVSFTSSWRVRPPISGGYFCPLLARWPRESLLIQSNIQLAKFPRAMQLLAFVWRFLFNPKGAPVLLSFGESFNSPLTGRCGGQLAARTEVRPWSHLPREKLVALHVCSHFQLFAVVIIF